MLLWRRGWTARLSNCRGVGHEANLSAPYAGVLSAYGMGLADLSTIRERAIESQLSESLLPQLQQILAELTAEGVAEIRQQGETQT